MAHKSVLIVHSDRAFTDQLVTGLAAAAPGVEVVVNSAGAEGVALAQSQVPNVMVVQADLPGMDGFTVVERVKSDAASAKVPIVLVTHTPTEATALRARQSGAIAFLSTAGPVGPLISKLASLAVGAGPAVAPAPPVVAAPEPEPVAAAVAEPPAPPSPAVAEPDMPREPMSAAPVPLDDVIREPMGAPLEQTLADIIPTLIDEAEEPLSATEGDDTPLIIIPAIPTMPEIPEMPPMPMAPPTPVISEPETSFGAGVPQPVSAPVSAPGAGLGVPQPLGFPDDSTMGTGVPMPVSASVEADVSVGADGEMPHIDDLLRLMLQRGGSDLHITVGSPPGIRQRGEIIPVEDMRPLTNKETTQMVFSLLSEEQRRRFETELELDFAYSIPSVSRFRANVFQQRSSIGAVFRVIPIKIPTMDELMLPKVCKFLAERPRGLVLITGPTGSGKSTTLAAMINHVNENRAVHIITMEDPIEFMHRNKKAYVNQREVGEDTHSFASALKRVLRQDPDVILVGEMRDLETISAAITAAETGHLVFATLHTTGAPETVDRIIDVFPPHQQQQVRMQLSSTLEGVLSQTLLRSTDGRSRVMAMEIMLGIPAISNLIREGKTHQMETIIQGGAQLGMQTLDQNLKNLLTAGKVTFEEAISKAKSPRELAGMVGRKI